MSESDQLNSTNNTGNTFISQIKPMADQTQGGNPQHYNSGEWAMRQYLLVCLEKCLPNCPTDNECPNNNKNIYIHGCELTLLDQAGENGAKRISLLT